jgi:ABC-type antimicrobial peptide transport system permease subunit
MALGATGWDIASLVLRQSVFVTILGILVGIPIAMAGARLLQPLLFGVTTTDFVALAGAGLLMAVTGLAAAGVPARRAMRVDPLQALRAE